ncbi:MAG: putative peptidoglycan glycosyltransferase FtsW [Verrucomicrobiota bacterium]
MSRGLASLLVISVLLLTALGFVMLQSTGAYSLEGQEDAMSGVRRQAVWLVLGLTGAAVMAFTDYHLLKRWAWPAFWVLVGLLALCYVPGIGVTKGGAHRWIGFRIPGVGGVQGQPSELAKITVIIALAAWCSTFRDRRKSFRWGFIYPLGIVALPVALIAGEVDLGTASLIFLACTGMLFVAGTRVIYILGLMLLGGTLLTAAIQKIPNRMARITAFRHLNDPDVGKLAAEIKDMNYQQTQAIIALGSGGVQGKGLGESRQKLYYLPLPHTDSVFAIVGEELGLTATLGVIVLFTTGGLAGILIALQAPDRFGKLLGFGLMALIIGQAAINIGVTTGSLPNKGMPLPFISYGGSNLFSCLIAVGIVLNIHRQSRDEEYDFGDARPAVVMGG